MRGGPRVDRDRSKGRVWLRRPPQWSGLQTRDTGMGYGTWEWDSRVVHIELQCTLKTGKHTHTHMHTRTHPCTHARTHAHAHTHMYARTHTILYHNILYCTVRNVHVLSPPTEPSADCSPNPTSSPPVLVLPEYTLPPHTLHPHSSHHHSNPHSSHHHHSTPIDRFHWRRKDDDRRMFLIPDHFQRGGEGEREEGL